MLRTNTTFSIKQGDTLPALYERLYNADGTAIDLTHASSIELEIRRIDGSTLIKNLSNGVEIVGDPVDGVILCRWVPSDTSVPGRHIQEVHVTYVGGDDLHVPNDRKGYHFVVTRQAVPD